MANGDAGDRYTRFSRSGKILDFAKEVIADGKVRGRRMRIGRLKNLFGVRGMRRQGFDRSAPLWLTDDTILKYTNHPKASKGATVPVNLLPALARALDNPKHIYLDTSSKNKNKGNIIYIGTINHPQYRDKVIKAVIHIDFTRNGETYHKVKSYGIVDRVDMKGKQYRKMK